MNGSAGSPYKGTRGTVFFLAAIVAGAAWWFFSGSGHLPQAVAGEPGITVSAITVTGSNPVPGQADAFYGGEGTSVTFSVTVKNTGGSDIAQTLQNQFVQHRYSADDPSVPWKYLGSLDKPVYIPLAGIKKGESKTITLVNESLYRSTLYLNFRVDETYLIHKANEPNIESPMAVIKILDKSSSSLQPASGAGNPPAGTPAGTKSCAPQVSIPGAKFRDLPPYPRERAGTETSVHWVAWGTGEFARAFRNCEAAGNECQFGTGTRKDEPSRYKCAGNSATTINRVGSYYWIVADSGITGTGPGGTPQLRTFDGIGFKADSVTGGPPPPPPPGELPESTPPQKPRYQEL